MSNPFQTTATSTAPANPFQTSNTNSAPNPFLQKPAFGTPFGSGTATGNATKSAANPFASNDGKAPPTAPFAKPANSMFSFAKGTKPSADKHGPSQNGTAFGANAKRPGSTLKPNGVAANRRSVSPGLTGASDSDEASAPTRQTNDPHARKVYEQLRRDGIEPPSWPSNPGDDKSKTGMAKFRESYETYRQKVRVSLTKAGLIDDPEKRRSLKDAIPFKGICEDMCPEYEKITRITESDVVQPEKSPRTGIPNTKRMVKKLARSAAGQEAPLPMDVRSVATLRKSLDYLIDKLLATDHRLPSIHGFIWDRTRAIRRDFAFFSSLTPEELKTQTYVLENIARFHVTALHLLSQPGKANDDFVAQQEVEQLGKSLLSLRDVYDDCNEQEIVCENEAEFRAYYLLFHARDDNILETLQRQWRAELWNNSDEIRTAVSLVEAMQSTQDFHGPLKSAPSMAAAGAFSSFFRIVEDPSVSYTMACFAEIHFPSVRRHILSTVNKSLARPKDTAKDVTVDVLTRFLRFDTAQESIDFAKLHDLEVVPNEEAPNDLGRRYLVLDRNSLPHPRLAHQYNEKLVEVKRGGRSLPTVIHSSVFQEAEAEGSLFVSNAEDKPDRSVNSKVDTPHQQPPFGALNGSTFGAPVSNTSAFGFKPPTVTNTQPAILVTTQPRPANPFAGPTKPSSATTTLSQPVDQRIISTPSFPAQPAAPSGNSSNPFAGLKPLAPPPTNTSTTQEPSNPAAPMFNFPTQPTPSLPTFGTSSANGPLLNPTSPPKDPEKTAEKPPSPPSESKKMSPPPQPKASVPVQKPPPKKARPPPGPSPLSQTFTPSPAASPKKRAPPPAPKDLLGDFTRWFVMGDQGLLQEFRTFMAEGVIHKAYLQFEQEEAAKEQARLEEKAERFRIYNISLKFFYRWKNNARAKRLKAVRLAGRQQVKEFYEARRQAEKKVREDVARKKRRREAAEKLSRGGPDDLLSVINRKRPSRREAEQALLDSGVLSGIQNEREAAASIVRDELGTPTASAQTSRAPSPATSIASTGSGTGKLAKIREALGRSKSAFRRSMPSLASSRSSASPDTAKRESRVSARWQLKAMGIVTLPDGTAVPETMARDMYKGIHKRYPSLGPHQSVSRRASVTSMDRGASPFRAPRPSSSLSFEAPGGSKRKRPTEDDDDVEDPEGSPHKRVMSDAEKLVSELRAMREEMEEDTSWFRTQNERMASEIPSRGSTPWDGL